MDEHTPTPTVATEQELSFWRVHRFLLLIIATVIISILMVSVGIVMYNVSGTAQLDLSRPGYRSVSDQVDTENQITDYSSSGPVTAETVKAFTTLYDKQAGKDSEVDAFNGDPLNPEILEFSDPVTSVE
jgi:cell division protein FtsL